MKSNKTGFFRKLMYSAVDMRLYPLIVRESVFSAFGYFCKLVLLFSVIISIGITADFFNVLPDYTEVIESSAPNFEISNGKFVSTSPIDVKMSSSVYVCTNDAMKFDISGDDILNAEEMKQRYFVVINSEDVDLYTKIDKATYTKIGQFILPKTGFIDKQMLVSYWKDFEQSYLARLFVLVMVTISLFCFYGIYRCWQLLFYMTVVFFFNFIFINKLRVRDYFKISVYVSGLPIILELISFCIAKGLPDGTEFIIMLIASIYIYYALKTIKLDSILLTAFGNTPEEKIINAINKAQEELQKQINEIEEEERKKLEAKKQKKQEEKKEEENSNDNEDKKE